MKYSKELHERVRQNLRMFDYPRFDDGDIDALLDEIEHLTAEIARLQEKIHDEMSQLEIATDLGNKRWFALNEIYENGEKHNANWCKRKAQEGLGIK